jgi:Ankyrin repeats (many copies)
MRFLTYADLSPGKLGKAFDKVRAAIESGDLRSADVKKLHAGGYYRAKLDYTNRLLLQFVRHGDETACLALEIIENHAYDRSRFLRGATVDEAKIDLDAETTASGVETTKLRYIHPARAEFHFLDKPLSFDDVQEEIYRLRPPVVLVGAAGSGKTVLTLAKMRLVEGSVAYITQSPYLAQRSRSLYFSHGFESERQSAEFLSYRELLESIRVPGGRAVKFTDFHAWFERHKREIRFADAHQCFEEIRGVLTSRPEGPLSRDAYLALGVRQSIFAQAEREIMYALFEKYRAWLAEGSLFEPNLVAHDYLGIAEPCYDFVVVDEVQDLTNVELALILKMLKARGAFLLSGDSNQIVHPNFFSWSSVKSLFWRDESLAGEQRIAVLDVNFRNAKAVVRLANALLKVKHARFGSIDKETNGLVRPAADDEGSVVGLPASDAVLADLDRKTRLSTDVAVLVLRDEHKEEARKRLGTPLVFSVHEAKGLEYATVVLFRFISSERAAYAEIGDGVKHADLDVDELAFRRARDKGDKSLEVYKFFANALYVAITRAVHRVYIIESDTAHPLLDLLGVEFSSDARDVQSAKSSVEDWQREARKLELQGKDEQARAIRRTILHTTPVPWTVLDAAGYRALADKALAPGCVSNKARQSLFEYACFHEDRPLADQLARAAGFAPAARYDEQRMPLVQKVISPYLAKKHKDILWQTELYGVDFRSPMNLTPLMLAAFAGNVELCAALVDRGARLDATDHFGKTAMHWALKHAYDRPDFARASLASLWEVVAPQSIDAQVDGRLYKIGREQGEYFYFALTIVLHKRLYRSRLVFLPGITSGDLLGGATVHFPENVLRGYRKKRPYLNGLLARNEPGSAASPNRKLWRRVRHGYYMPNLALSLRVTDASGVEEWKPIDEVLGTRLLTEHSIAAPVRKGPGSGESVI